MLHKSIQLNWWDLLKCLFLWMKENQLINILGRIMQLKWVNRVYVFVIDQHKLCCCKPSLNCLHLQPFLRLSFIKTRHFTCILCHALHAQIRPLPLRKSIRLIFQTHRKHFLVSNCVFDLTHYVYNPCNWCQLKLSLICPSSHPKKDICKPKPMQLWFHLNTCYSAEKPALMLLTASQLVCVKTVNLKKKNLLFVHRSVTSRISVGMP